ncbi:hypothetical protein T02_4952 [Trichinella nativa]|uniref:Uncharacterized protein n=1 Tax=Trichinella nativa TaxID=6335 RepID=A0A0V1LEH8_9BILA|nr:hypothetical protein T02_4952 [Trichinella nativa]
MPLFEKKQTRSKRFFYLQDVENECRRACIGDDGLSILPMTHTVEDNCTNLIQGKMPSLNKWTVILQHIFLLNRHAQINPADKTTDRKKNGKAESCSAQKTTHNRNNVSNNTSHPSLNAIGYLLA